MDVPTQCQVVCIRPTVRHRPPKMLALERRTQPEDPKYPERDRFVCCVYVFVFIMLLHRRNYRDVVRPRRYCLGVEPLNANN